MLTTRIELIDLIGLICPRLVGGRTPPPSKVLPATFLSTGNSNRDFALLRVVPKGVVLYCY